MSREKQDGETSSSRPRKICLFSVLGLMMLVIFASLLFSSWPQTPITGSSEGTGRSEPQYQRGVERYFPQTAEEVAAFRHKLFLEHPDLFDNTAENLQISGWQEVGPFGAGVEPSLNSGRIRAIAIDPVDPNLMYVGTAMGGVWRSSDGGNSWENVKDDLMNPSVGAVAIHPMNRSVWIGTGENGGFNVPGTSFSATGTYLYSSSDFGETWTRRTGFPFLASAVVTKIAFDPTRALDMYVATTGGLYKSTDGGSTFVLRRSGQMSDVVIRPMAGRQPEVLIADQDSTPGVFRSTDGGNSFTLSTLTGAVTSQMARMQFGQFRLFPQIVYVSVSTPGGALLGIWKTNDFGATAWTRVNNPTCCATQGNYDQAIAVNPLDSTKVYLGWVNRAVFRSTNGGSTWSPSSPVHEDIHSFAFHPIDPNVMFHVSDGGVYKSTDQGQTWRDAGGRFINVHQVYYLTPDPTDPQREWIGTQDNGVNVGHDDFGRYLNVTCCDGGDIAFAGNNVYTSVTGLGPGPNTIQTATLPISFPTSMTPFSAGLRLIDAFPPMPLKYDGTNLYTFSFNQVYRTPAGRLPWSSIRTFPTNIKTIAVALDGRVYAGFANTASSLIRVFDGTTWITPDTQPTGRDVLGFGIGCNSSRTAYVSLSGISGARIYRTTDGGRTWVNATGDLPTGVNTSALLVGPTSDNTCYVATDLGVFVTTNGGMNWVKISTGLPRIPFVTTLSFRPARDRLLIGTYGRGVWEADLDPTTVGLYSWFSPTSGGRPVTPPYPARGDNYATTMPVWRDCVRAKRSPDYTLFLIEGRVFSPSFVRPAGTVPLYSWYSPSRGDNFATTDPVWAGRPGDTRSPDYYFVRFEGYIYSPTAPQPPGTSPLYSWYSPSRGDNFATTDPVWAGRPGDTRSPDYYFVRLEGYVLPR